MPPNHTLLCLAITSISLNSGCSAEHVYGSGQGWQREQCRTLADPEQSKDCMDKTQRSYDDYQFERNKTTK